MAGQQRGDVFGNILFPHLGKIASEMLKGVDSEVSDMLRGFDTSSDTIDTDLTKAPDGYTVYADLPGVKKEDVQVYVNETGNLVITAKRTRPSEERLFGRRRHGASKAEVPLPKDANAESCTSSLKDGVLTVKMPLAGERVRKWVPVA